MVKIVRGNLKLYLANLTLATKIESLSELRFECKRAEKLIKENRSRVRAVNEVDSCARAYVEEWTMTGK